MISVTSDNLKDFKRMLVLIMRTKAVDEVRILINKESTYYEAHLPAGDLILYVPDQKLLTGKMKKLDTKHIEQKMYTLKIFTSKRSIFDHTTLIDN